MLALFVLTCGCQSPDPLPNRVRAAMVARKMQHLARNQATRFALKEMPMSEAFEALCDALRGATKPYAIYQSNDWTEAELTQMEQRLGAPLPAAYRAMLAEEGILYLTKPIDRSRYDDNAKSPSDPAFIDPDPRVHLHPGPAGVDSWFSFLRPAQTLRATQNLVATIRDDMRNIELADRYEKAVIFQQGYGDFNYYLFVNQPAGVSIVGFDAPGLPTNSFVDHMRSYATWWLRHVT